ncbi:MULTISPECIES: hypothetical protein [Enterobacterales]|uniref:Uncharacterized protein n=1 Tax=Serratia quinivorans TaxID=137545 RepID=A0A379YBJ9_9GAMM|nr:MULTISPECIES: hypothetical protein [Enterobacterales]RYM59051.1 hypothetical protein BSR03_20555 [Serratia proteamaculans]CAI1699691.1 Uncharacterised protein [Serratia quinivorans]SPY75865.1 Uncharacterised protein [Providencia rustigianii]SUI43171.1 Uncharacterised protein [Serratia quinivorans]
MIKTVEIKMNLLHKNIVEVLSEGETIGFIVNTDNKEKPHSLVTPNGNDAGDFDCPRCAIDAAVRTHVNVGSEYATEFKVKGSTSPRKLLLLALLAMLADE